MAQDADSDQKTPPGYIAEMNHFYVYCTDEETLNESYDCQCLAVKYLDARRAKGVDITTREILSSIKSECLHDSSTAPDWPKESETLGGITDDQFKEANGFFNSCKSDRQLSTAYDCECLAAHYLDARVQRGPEPPSSSLMMYIKDKCPNTVGMAGSAYQNCLNMGSLMPAGHSQEEFCACYANAFAELYGKSGQAYSSDLSVSLQTQAMQQCSGQ